MEDECLQRAASYAAMARNFDNNRNASSAIQYYALATEALIKYVRTEADESMKNKARELGHEYTSRAEELAKQNPGYIIHASPEVKKSILGVQDAALEGIIELSIIKDVNVHWEDVVGLDSARAVLVRSLEMPDRLPGIFNGACKRDRSLLLWGPPGTGKTQLARAAATELGCTFFNISAADIVSKWQGESERLVRALFARARREKKALIFIDELDSVGGARGESETDGTRRMKTELLTQLDGVANTDDGVFFLAATNLPWLLDAALHRRFNNSIYVRLPDVSARRALFEMNLRNTAHTLTSDDLDEFANDTEGLSGSDIRNIVTAAARHPLSMLENARFFRKSEDGRYMEPCAADEQGAVPMTWRDLNDGQVRPPAVTREQVSLYMRTTRRTMTPKLLREYEEYESQK